MFERTIFSGLVADVLCLWGCLNTSEADTNLIQQEFVLVDVQELQNWIAISGLEADEEHFVYESGINQPFQKHPPLRKHLSNTTWLLN